MSNGTQMMPVIDNGEVLVLPQAYVGALHALDKWLHIKDWEAVNIIFGSAAALYVPGDPLWLRVIGAPGSGKTELLRAIAGHSDSFELGNLTSASLAGGFKGGYKLLNRVNGKRVITPDLSPLVTKNRETRRQLFGILRSVYDGSLVSAYGSDEGLVDQKAHFDWLVATTPSIESQRNFDAELGERFLDLRPKVDRNGAVERAFQNTLNLKKMREELKNAVGILLDFCEVSQTPQIHPDIAAKMPHLANLTSVLRSPVPRDKYHHVSYVPQPEVGTRIAQSLNKLAKGLALIKGKQEADWEEYVRLVRVAADSIPSTRRAILAEYLSGRTKVEDIAKATHFSDGQVSELLQELQLLGIKQGGKLLDFSKAKVTTPGPNWPLQIDYSEAIARR